MYSELQVHLNIENSPLMLQGLFSATLTANVRLLVQAGLRHPVTVTLREAGRKEDAVAMPSTLHNFYLVSGRSSTGNYNHSYLTWLSCST